MWRLAVTLILLALVQGAAPAAAQWSVAGEIGVAGFSGTSRDSAGISVGPYRPTTFAIQVDRETGRVRLELALLYARPGLAGRQGNELFVQYGVVSLWEIAPALSVRLARFGTGGAVWVEAGPAVDLWQFDGEQRHRVGARAGVALEWPLARSLSGSLRAGGVLSGSMVDSTDVPSGVERVATRRLGVGLGLRYRL
jgi:hypothetical protein